MEHSFSRTEILIGTENLQKLKESKIAIFGIGGVGSFTAEALARTGVGNLVLIDGDVICLSNLNRQIHANHKTLGQAKVLAMKERILDINPEAQVETYQMLYTSQTAADLLREDYDYVVDAIDMVSAKIDLITRCTKKGIKIISSMGAGNKLDPTKFQVSDLFKTSVCPLARVMRKELKARGVNKLKVVYSTEPPIKPLQLDTDKDCPSSQEASLIKKRQTPGSMSFVPPVAGLIIAAEVVNDIIHN